MAKNNDRKQARELKFYNRQLREAGIPAPPKSLYAPQKEKEKKAPPQRYFPDESGSQPDAGGGEQGGDAGIKDQLDSIERDVAIIREIVVSWDERNAEMYNMVVGIVNAIGT